MNGKENAILSIHSWHNCEEISRNLQKACRLQGGMQKWNQSYSTKQQETIIKMKI